MTAARAAIDLNSQGKIHVGEELAYSTLGSIYFTLNDFDSARSYYLRYMRMTQNDERSPNFTILRAGLACEIAGDRTTAVGFYRRMKEPNDRDRAWDSYNYRQGQELVRQPLTDAEALVVKGGNEFTQKKYAQSIDTYNEALAKCSGNPDTRLKALYGIQQSQFEAGMFAKAEETSRRLLALKPVNETWIIPHAWFKLGETYEKQEKLADALAAFKKVGEYDDYDFQERLEPHVREEVQKLESRVTN